MKIKVNSILTLFVAAVFLTSCSSDDDATPDTQNPSISIVEPHDEEEVAPGSELHFEAVFTDNVELASYKIEIHDAFDDHTHSIMKSSHENNPWSWSQVFEIPAGLTSYEAVEHIDIPTEINGEAISEGHYHFGLYVTDAAGNEEQAFFEIHIEGDAHDHDNEEDHDH